MKKKEKECRRLQQELQQEKEKLGNVTVRFQQDLAELNFVSVSVKADLHSIRFSSVFVRFFTFLLLHEKVCAILSAFLYAHIRTNQTVAYWTKVFQKTFYFEISILSFILHTQNF